MPRRGFVSVKTAKVVFLQQRTQTWGDGQLGANQPLQPVAAVSLHGS